MAASRKNVARALTLSLQSEGFPEVTDAMVENIISAWLAGRRGVLLPHGIIGALVGKHLDEFEAERPGVFADLAKINPAPVSRRRVRKP